MMVSVNGYFEGPNHDLSWHNVDPEFNEFAARQTKSAGTLLFGRKTYELMRDFWPSEQGRKGDPIIADIMNNAHKIVFSKTLNDVEETEHWRNVSLIKDNVLKRLQELKKQKGEDMAVLGSNNLSVNLIKMKVLDEVRLMVNPVVISKGTPLFKGLRKNLRLKLLSSKEFKSGNILLIYKPQY